MGTRKEHDFIGELEIPDDVYYGVQTYRALENFKMSGRVLKEYPFFVKAFAQVKKAAALANKDLGMVPADRADYIVKACDRIINGEFLDQFVVDMVQGGAGTSTNMNANEVITNVALEMMGHKKGEYQYLHPNDNTNFGQSTNDAYPSSIKVAVHAKMGDLLKAMEILKNELEIKAKEWKDILKIGRTELEDAVPTTLGNTFNAFASYLKSDIEKITKARESMTYLNLGATAIGTGICCHPDYKDLVEKYLSDITGTTFRPAEDFIAATQDTADFVHVSGALKTAAVRLSKIANDIRLMNSGPRCGLGEVNLPQMQPGSSIMPGKVNPVIPEVVGEACYEVIGNDVTIALCSERGEFELNAFEPGIAYALFNSLVLLENAMLTLANKAIKHLTANPENCKKTMLNSVCLVTALNPYIGYENSASVAKEALQTGKSVADIVLERGLLTKEKLDEYLTPENMLNPRIEK
ncbi:aspartate ammonia-lyase [Campylobacter sp. LH-2024]|uniref:Aspartate ammonia-lyase n=1 Tax=Campylobacter molothri TaxID=1032242 RepID=A0ACC5VZN9_9BACT|nr:aspartate ammonia-lyase [Campylobacter sp. RM10537]MBZ7928086.1 aspartate ammonia-lyase [Campylobacter sp. RM10542]MBZ7929689.1 aspartate ammonia-lyase [Campylobacter sp. W0067]MBZ7930838.1 aspartate ammonia-lyase [Campylobacter sp. RM12910]MBZ7936864.1 aspartate ammonia-lyase [Campylobacter sp. RM10538]MBZ7940113.1 aspartate ammonia-lyase [Campylobacter sp. W0047]MBZ7942229.1 aspartate ammonia-lyase [Campylobacter sp. W0045]MBZ7943569.1 aspartate ammonia-lyase [Campylobacter sp. RM13744]